jgi:hypothetical protein
MKGNSNHLYKGCLWLFILLATGSLLSCTPSLNSTSSTNPLENKHSVIELIGKWQNENRSESPYGHLIFKEDSNATFLSRGDTIYYFKYFIKSNNLFLIDIYGKVVKAEIIELDKEKLVLNGLENKQRIQKFRPDW